MYYTYILTNKTRKVLYVGVTSDIQKRMIEHKEKIFKGFTAKYNVHNLIYLEEYSSIFEAIEREKQLKSWSRQKKVELIETINPDWEEIVL